MDEARKPGAARTPHEGGAEPAADPLVGGTLAGRYRVVRKLGQGAMGAVYLGEHLRMGREDAIKVLTRSFARDPEALARFTREARNASFISHPNVCAIYDFGETADGTVFLAMEYVPGEPLGRILERDGPLPLPRTIAIASSVAAALAAAHERGIVHRDLKPDNIMIAAAPDGRDRVKVVDFGIAKAIGGDEPGQDVTRHGFVVGTPDYMSPEQLTGDPVDGRSDIYSLAVVVYRMLTARLPFEAETSQDRMIKRLTDRPMRLDATGAGPFPPALQSALDRALSRRADDRWASAGDFAASLERAASGERTGTAGTGRVADAGTAGAVRGAAATGTAGATGTAAAATADDVPATRVAPRQAPRRLPVRTLALAAVALATVSAAGAALFLRGSDDGGGRSSPDGPLQVVTADSASNGGGAGPDGGGDGGADSVAPSPVPPAPAPHDGRGERASTAINAGNAADVLYRALDRLTPPEGGAVASRVVAAAADTARLAYDAPGLEEWQRGLAAFVYANALDKQGDVAGAIRWTRRALAHDSVRLARGYRSYLEALQGSHR